MLYVTKIIHFAIFLNLKSEHRFFLYMNILLNMPFQDLRQKYTINCVIAERPDTRDILAMVRSIHIKSINK